MYNIILLFNSISLSLLAVGFYIKKVGDPCFRQTTRQIGTPMQTVRGTQVTGQKADRDGTTAVANNVKGKKKACNKTRVITEESTTKNKLVKHEENQQREEVERETLHTTK